MHNQTTSASGAAPAGTYTSMPSARSLRADSPPESASGIRDALSHGEEILASIHAALSHLESRLDTVITPIPPSPGEANSQRNTVPTIAMSHMRERLGAFNGSLSDALSRLNTLRDRVEV